MVRLGQRLFRRGQENASACRARTRPLPARRSSSSRILSTLSKPWSTCAAAQALLTCQPTTRGTSTLAQQPSMPSTYAQEPQEGASLSILGLSQAMVDFTACVPESFLKQCHVDKGARRVISLQERHEVIESLDRMGCSSTVSPGGSVANTLVDVARLSAASGGPPMRVSMAGSVGTDALGCYFNAQMKKAGVDMLVDPINPSHTGTVMVLTTPDAQRSFLSFFDSGEMRLTPHLAQAISSTKMLVIEGYMLELPGAAECLHAIASLARSQGIQVALTAGDPGVVERHRSTMQSLMSRGLVDVLFSNCEEAAALLKDVAGDRGFGGSRPHESTPNDTPNTTARSASREASNEGHSGGSHCSGVDAAACVDLNSSSSGGRGGARGARESIDEVVMSFVGAHGSCGCDEGLRAMAEGRESRPHDCEHGVHQVGGGWWEKVRGAGAKGAEQEGGPGASSGGAVTVEEASISSSGQGMMGSSSSLSSFASSTQGQGSASSNNSSYSSIHTGSSSASSDATLAGKGCGSENQGSPEGLNSKAVEDMSSQGEGRSAEGEGRSEKGGQVCGKGAEGMSAKDAAAAIAAH
ncbi:Ribokinase-like protein, partial [Dunaliella salina]